MDSVPDTAKADRGDAKVTGYVMLGNAFKYFMFITL